MLFFLLHTEYHPMQSQAEGSEATEELEPSERRVIFVNRAQPHKYCSNKIRYASPLSSVNFKTTSLNARMLNCSYPGDLARGLGSEPLSG